VSLAFLKALFRPEKEFKERQEIKKMMYNSDLSFEQGPIRPPNEARSLLLRITRNCPWNQCLFCPVYKKKKFSLRTVEEIKKDIQTARDIIDDVKALSWKLGESGLITNPVIASVINNNYSHSYKSVAMWLYYGARECFFQDADNFLVRAKDLVEILRFLREKIPKLKRVTTYSRARTISRKSLSELKEVKQAGLDRVHIGLESGYTPVLKFMKKGVTAKQHIEAGTKVISAGMSLSEYVMPGLGGKEMWREHAVETAKVLNHINPQYIRIRSLRVPAAAPLYQKLKSGEFKMPTDDQVVEEIIYRIGRRGGVFTSTDDLINDKSTYNKISRLALELSAKGSDETEAFINKMANSYV